MARDRDDPRARRTQASLAIDLGPEGWMLVNATTDVTAQINAQPRLRPAPGTRETPIRRVLLTDAQLDHVLGLFELRQAVALEVLGSPAVLRAVRDQLGLDRTLAPYVDLTWRELPLDEPVALSDAVSVRLVDTHGRAPRYADGKPSTGWSVGCEIGGPENRTTLYAPAVGAISPDLIAACQRATDVLFDGTFWSDDEPSRSGIGPRSSREMGHVPIAGLDGSLALLSSLRATHRAYTHLNNTNPILDPDSPERRELSELGIGVASDGEAWLI